MSKDQRKLVAQVLTDLLLPFRKKDVDEAMRYINANGGIDALSMAFYQNLDLGVDKFGTYGAREPQDGVVFPGTSARPHLGQHQSIARHLAES